ncbi:hypothetical protein SAMN05518801_10738 [Novosphingobium sp. CF614]|uniref:gp53-like domain-containing protein n=1 Tax=Novosphingobium sp. CF614 TaxID=1884364 RepID=UPI0008E5B081|nr:hypothetical protein [Novosphingobium sp. CF614]SFG08470.1 hypothetical protein SAMN05518801_10738 [Novosphingobium sp. CF614]
MAVHVLKLTDAGLAAVQAASGTDPVSIIELGLTNTPFDYAPTLEALPGEFKRLDVASGVAAAPNITHLTAYDNSTDVWTASGLGLFLADGTLFAVHASADPVMSKVGLAFALLAFDIAFDADLAANISYGNAIFAYPPATEETRGVARLATQERVDDLADAGDDAETIVTPRTLRSRLAAMLAAINASIAAVIASLNAETTARTDGDNALNAAIGAEAATRAAADDVLNTAIGNEATARADGDSALNAAIGAEAATRAAADDALNTAIGNEATARADGDSALNAALAAEATARTNADNALAAHTVTGAGLVSGGGALSTNPSLTVSAASGAQLQAALANDVAVTPAAFGALPRADGATAYEVHPGGTLIQRGQRRTTYTTQQSVTITFPIAFADTDYDLQLTPVIPAAGNYDNYCQEVDGTRSTTGVQIYLQDPSSGASSNLAGFNWRAEGRA